MLAGRLHVSDGCQPAADQPPRCRWRGRETIARHEPCDADEPPDEWRWVDVSLAVAKTEMERAGGVADDRAGGDHVALGVKTVREVAVCGPPSVCVLDDDIGATGDRAAERDATGGDRCDGIASVRCVLDPAIARTPATHRLTERIDDRS